MNNIYIIIYSLLPLLLFTTCTEEKSETVTVKAINGSDAHVLHVNEIKDSIALKLSALIEDVKFIQMETRPESLIGYAQYYVGDKFIVVGGDNNGIFIYSADGSYLQKVANYGRGPNEVINPTWSLDEPNNILYITSHSSKSPLISVDLSVGEYNVTDVPKALSGRLENIIVKDDSILVCAPNTRYANEANDYYVFYQTLSGKFLGGIKTLKSARSTDNREDILYQEGEALYCRPMASDTMYLVKDNTMQPHLIFDISDLQTDPTMRPKMSVVAVSKNFLLLSVSIPTEKKTSGNGGVTTTYDSRNIYLDKTGQQAFLMSKITNDYCHEDLYFYRIKVQPNGKLFVVYDALQFKEMADKLKGNPDVSKEILDQITAIDANLTNNDNPVIMVGKLK